MDAIVAVDLGVDRAVDAEVHAEQAACLLRVCAQDRQAARIVSFSLRRNACRSPIRTQRFLRARALVGRPMCARRSPRPARSDRVSRCAASRCGRRILATHRPSLISGTLDERRDLAREELLTLGVREPCDRCEVSLTTTASPRRQASTTVCAEGAPRDLDRLNGGDAACIRPTDDELVALDLCVIDSARLEMLADQPDGGLLDFDRILAGAAVARSA